MKDRFCGPCGLFCGACGADDCSGCQSEHIDTYVLKCKFRSCAKERGLEFCCDCDDYPCEDLAKFMHDEWPHHWTMESNLSRIKIIGKENWLKAMRAEWTCKNCGKEIMWYQKTCECGNELVAWKLPA